MYTVRSSASRPYEQGKIVRAKLVGIKSVLRVFSLSLTSASHFVSHGRSKSATTERTEQKVKMRRIFNVVIGTAALALVAAGCGTGQQFASSSEHYSCSRFGFEEQPIETKFDWTEYSGMMLSQIRENWRIPELAKMGAEGNVKIRFLVAPNGNVTCMDFMSRSDRPSFDIAAWNAVAAAQPLPALPPERPTEYGEFVSITFFYNQDTSPEGAIEFEGNAVPK